MPLPSMRHTMLWMSIVALFGVIGAPVAQAQESEQDTAPTTPQITLNVFLDAYYTYDLSRPGDNLRPSFLYNHSRHNEFSLNLALLDVGYEGDRIRGQLGLMAGTYPQYNYAAEQPMLRSVFEAWAGVRLLDDVWWDAGIFPSHIGYESAISTRNPTLTRSLASENTPYFLSGTRLTWSPNTAWTLGVTLANGWQNIQETPGNSSKGGGTQVTWTPDEAWTLNSSTWISDEYPDGSDRLRLFHDLYGSYQAGRVLVLLGVDTGTEQQGAVNHWAMWWSATALTRVSLNERVATALRVEYYHDPEQVIIATGAARGISLAAASLNLDVNLADAFMWRVEGRAMREANAFFTSAGQQTPYNFAVTTSLALDFDASLTPRIRR